MLPQIVSNRSSMLNSKLQRSQRSLPAINEVPQTLPDIFSKTKTSQSKPQNIHLNHKTEQPDQSPRTEVKKQTKTLEQTYREIINRSTILSRPFKKFKNLAEHWIKIDLSEQQEIFQDLKQQKKAKQSQQKQIKKQKTLDIFKKCQTEVAIQPQEKEVSEAQETVQPLKRTLTMEYDDGSPKKDLNLPEVKKILKTEIQYLGSNSIFRKMFFRDKVVEVKISYPGPNGVSHQSHNSLEVLIETDQLVLFLDPYMEEIEEHLQKSILHNKVLYDEIKECCKVSFLDFVPKFMCFLSFILKEDESLLSSFSGLRCSTSIKEKIYAIINWKLEKINYAHLGAFRQKYNQGFEKYLIPKNLMDLMGSGGVMKYVYKVLQKLNKEIEMGINVKDLELVVKLSDLTCCVLTSKFPPFKTLYSKLLSQYHVTITHHHIMMIKKCLWAVMCQDESLTLESKFSILGRIETWRSYTVLELDQYYKELCSILKTRSYEFFQSFCIFLHDQCDQHKFSKLTLKFVFGRISEADFEDGVKNFLKIPLNDRFYGLVKDSLLEIVKSTTPPNGFTQNTQKKFYLLEAKSKANVMSRLFNNDVNKILKLFQDKIYEFSQTKEGKPIQKILDTNYIEMLLIFLFPPTCQYSFYDAQAGLGHFMVDKPIFKKQLNLLQEALMTHYNAKKGLINTTIQMIEICSLIQ